MKNKNFFMISNKIHEYGLKPPAFAVYCYLVRCADKAGSCYPSRATIAKKCKMSIRAVDLALNILIAEGLVKKLSGTRENNARTSNIYFVDNLLW